MEKAELDEIGEFAREASQALRAFEQELRAARNGKADDVVAFRSIHTAKGAAGFSGHPEFERVAHATELVLDRMREKAQRLDQGFPMVLAYALRCLHEMVKNLETTGETGPAPERLLARLEATASADNSRWHRDLRRKQVATTTEENRSETRPSVGALARRVSGTLRVYRGRDAVLELGQELRAVTEGLQRDLRGPMTPSVRRRLQQLSSIALAFEEYGDGTRARAVEEIWQRLPSAIRQLADLRKKQVRAEYSGGNLRVSPDAVEALSVALVHVVRNAVDHGIEPPNVRQRLGKPAEGVLRCSAFEHGDGIAVQVSDDGRGIDVDAVASKAVSLGFVSEDHIRRCNRDQILQLVFLPGFSTAREVTTTSGMGVGMDSVRASIEAIGGRVEVRSEPDRGATVRFIVPS